MSDLITLLNWRYATKKFDPAQSVPDDKLVRILEAIRLTASSSGLQPYHVLVVTNPELRAQIKPNAWGQGQITDCSHLLVFAAWDDYTTERVNAAFDLVNEVRGFKNEGWEAYRQQILASYPQRDAEVNYQQAAVDATPMEGFDATKVDEILGLRAKGLRSVVLLPLGYRDAAGDWLVNLKKVRSPLDQLVSTVS
jgi:nitroreductase/dihydropteridine reductase